MATSFHEFWLPRRGSTSEEYEDAFASDLAAGRFALADGATESSFSALWAQLLVNDFVQSASRDIDDWKTHIPALQDRWYESVNGPSLSWNVEAKLEQGAFATFLGVTLQYSGKIPQWQATAVGDSCVFHTRGPLLFSAFPIERADNFNNAPRLLGSRMSADLIQKTPALQTQGSGLAGDRLWLMTDALAQWCLREQESGGDPWNEMEQILSHPEPKQPFAAWIDDLRLSKKLHNDDVTLLAIEL